MRMRTRSTTCCDFAETAFLGLFWFCSLHLVVVDLLSKHSGCISCVLFLLYVSLEDVLDAYTVDSWCSLFQIDSEPSNEISPGARGFTASRMAGSWYGLVVRGSCQSNQNSGSEPTCSGDAVSRIFLRLVFCLVYFYTAASGLGV